MTTKTQHHLFAKPAHLRKGEERCFRCRLVRRKNPQGRWEYFYDRAWRIVPLPCW